jgi:hypothetical protein
MTKILVGFHGAAILAAMLVAAQPALAQYTYDPSNLDEQGPGIKYFGSVKDQRGAIIAGAVVVIQRQYLLVSDGQGRFRANLPATLPTDKVQVSCSKPDYRPVRIAKRLGPAGPKVTVQVDCVLRPAR